MKTEEETPQKREDNNGKERGAVLVVVVLVTVALLILTLPILSKLSGYYGITEKNYRSLAALNLAEAGIERAIWELNFGGVWDWVGDPDSRTLSLPSFQAADGTVVGDIEIQIQTPLGQLPFIESAGKVAHIDPLTVDKSIRVLLERADSPSVFTFGLFGEDGVDIDGNGIIDSYDSRKGAYGEGNRGEKGHTGTNATHEGCIDLRNNTIIFGNALSGPGTDPDAVIIVENNSQIVGLKEALSEPKVFDSVPAPEGLPFLGDYVLPNNSEDAILSSGEYSSFLLMANTTLTIIGDVVLYVTGPFRMMANSEIIVYHNSSLSLYVGGTFVQHSNSAVNNLTQDPTRLLVYGTDSFNGTMEWKANSSFYGAVYVPRAAVDYKSNADFYGSMIGKFIEISSNAQFHYDLALGDMDTVGGGKSWTYVVKAWHQADGN